MKLHVDYSSRFAKMRAHTATHLLHAQLAKIFPNTKQEGSLVDNDFLRFDFATDRLLDQFEIANIEKKINQIIYLACDVTIQEMNVSDAAKLGAKMFFEDKYGDKVRVVQITCHPEQSEGYNSELQPISTELCGGTHVENTKDIGCFAIISQEAVASGIKRITAITGPRVVERIQEVQSILDITVNKLGIKTASQLQDKLDKTLREYDEMKSKIESLESQTIVNSLKNTEFKSDSNFDKIIKISTEFEFKNVVFQAKTLFVDCNILIYNSEGGFAILTKGKSAKELLTKLGLKRGGNDTMIQGRDINVLKMFE